MGSAIEINLFGTILVCYNTSSFESMDMGKVVNFSGRGAAPSLPHLGAYAASKPAVVWSAQTMAYEMAGTGIDYQRGLTEALPIIL